MANWVARNSDQVWQLGENGTPHLINSEPNNYTYVDLENQPDPRMERWDGADGSRASTQAEIDAYDAADPVLVKEGKRDAAIARGQASLDQPVTASDLFDILGIE